HCGPPSPSLHDALPISVEEATVPEAPSVVPARTRRRWRERLRGPARPVLHVLSALRRPTLSAIVARVGLDATRGELLAAFPARADRKSTRLNSSHVKIS